MKQKFKSTWNQLIIRYDSMCIIHGISLKQCYYYYWWIISCNTSNTSSLENCLQFQRSQRTNLICRCSIWSSHYSTTDVKKIHNMENITIKAPFEKKLYSEMKSTDYSDPDIEIQICCSPTQSWKLVSINAIEGLEWRCETDKVGTKKCNVYFIDHVQWNVKQTLLWT